MELKTKEKVVLDSIDKYPYAAFSVYGDVAWNKTGSWRYVRPIYVESIPPCQAGCPTGQNVEKWLKLLAQKRYKEAFEEMRLENPFPRITGRVCFHPCENRCNRNHMGGAVSINMLEHFVADKGDDGEPAKPFDVEGGLKVAVIGAGPGGLAAAYHLRRLGHNVDVYEKSSAAGGMMRWGIPEYRLPKGLLDKEIERIQAMGINIHLNSNVTVADLQDRYDRIVIAIGAQGARNLNIPGEDLDGVMHGLEFLNKVNSKTASQINGSVAVIGGGNTAMDCARSALRLGAKEVTVYYRRTREQMPAFGEEIEAAEAEGVKFVFLRSPAEFTSNNNRIQLKMQVMQLGEPGEDGRRRPVPVEGSFEEFEADMVLLATGEVVEPDALGDKLDLERGVVPVNFDMSTKVTNVYAVGDVTQNPRTVTDALGMGKIAAIAIDAQFRGLDLKELWPRIALPTGRTVSMDYYLKVLKGEDTGTAMQVIEFDKLNKYHFNVIIRNPRPQLPVNERLKGFDEIYQSIDEELAHREVDRCMHCGRCIDCDNCYIYCPDGAITPKEGGGYEINYDYCKGCGVCVHECPRAAMALVEEPVEL